MWKFIRSEDLKNIGHLEGPRGKMLWVLVHANRLKVYDELPIYLWLRSFCQDAEITNTPQDPDGKCSTDPDERYSFLNLEYDIKAFMYCRDEDK